MAKKITIGWVRHVYSVREAADFGEAFGKETEINGDTFAALATVLRFYKPYRFAEFLIRYLIPDQMHSLIARYGTEDQVQRFERWRDGPGKRGFSHPRKRRPMRMDPTKKILRSLASSLEDEQRQEILFTIFETAPDLAFTICKHIPDFSTFNPAERGSSVTCKHGCGTQARVIVNWPDLDEDEEEDRDDDDLEEEDDC